jgi:hypothetical protein
MKYLENIIDTLKMEVAVLETKRAQMIEQLGESTLRTNCSLRDITSLCGSLKSFTRYINWARPTVLRPLERNPFRTHKALSHPQALVRHLAASLLPRE